LPAHREEILRELFCRESPTTTAAIVFTYTTTVRICFVEILVYGIVGRSDNSHIFAAGKFGARETYDHWHFFRGNITPGITVIIGD
jgi:hypothetical protein